MDSIEEDNTSNHVKVAMNTNSIFFKLFAIALLLSLSIPGLNPGGLQAGMAPVIVKYKIDVRLNPDEKSFSGDETLVYFNASSDTLNELQFHLYLNAFKSRQTTFMRESGRQRTIPEFKEENNGWINITSIHVESSPDLAGSLEFIQPDDGNKNDETAARLPLLIPVLPGDSVSMKIGFSGKVPKVIARSGYYGNFYYMAQWFPKIAVYEEGGWNCHQYHASSEYYANFGTYDVRITVPADYILDATGQQLSRQTNSDGTATYRYYQEDVHDFAWTACPDFIEAVDTYSTPGRPDVAIKLLLQPEHKDYVDRYFRALRASLDYVAEYLAPYPYAKITLVDPPRRTGTGYYGGMEYPTIIIAGARLFSPKQVMSPEGVTVHEFMHEYFYGIVASNEFEEAWIDEGITSYYTSKILEEEYGETALSTVSIAGVPVLGYSMFSFKGIPLISYWGELKGIRGALPSTGFYSHAGMDPMLKNSWEFYSRGSYANSVYTKVALMLQTIEAYIGKERMQDLMLTFYQKWQFKHPKTSDFLNVLQEKVPIEVVQLVNDMLYTAGTLDYSVSLIHSDSTGELEPGIFRSEVSVRRLGTISFPVDISIVFEDGEEVTEKWDGKDEWINFTYRKPSKVLSATVDPNGILALEHNVTNNSMRVKPDHMTTLRWAAQWLFWVQSFLLHAGFLL